MKGRNMGKKDYRTYLVIGMIAAAVCLFVIKFDFLVSLASLAMEAAFPLLLGCVVAYAVNIPLKRLERLYFPNTRSRLIQKTRRPVCIVLSFVFLTGVIFLIINIVVPELLSSIQLITVEIPPLLEDIWSWSVVQLDELPELQGYLANVNVNWQEVAKKTFDFLVTGAGGLFNSVITVISSVLSAVVNILVAFIFAIYLLNAKENLKRQAGWILQAFVKTAAKERICYVVRVFHETFTNFIVGQCMEAVIIGTLCAVLMTVLRLPYAVMTGTVVGATALIPVVGAYIGAAVGAFMVFTVDPIQALIFIAALVVLQQVEGNLIYPKVVGSAISLPGLWVLAAVTIGGGVMGIPGMLLGVPLAASAYRLLRDEVSARIDGNADRCGRSSDGNADRCGRSSGGNADCRGCPSDEDAESALSRQTKEKMEASSGAESSEQENGTL